jgi:lipopolysaccharide/colanic/teichoic acid biosynthesis glycosyltransferase
VASIPVARGRTAVRILPTSVVAIAERIASTVALIAVSPVLCASAAVLALQSGKSPLIAHRRVGWRRSTLWMLKLRTMWDDSPDRGRFRWIEPIDDQAGPLQKEADDPRVPSAFARFCRRHSVDELPQLLHVICGEMALVGPRPLTAQELERYYGADAQEILEAKPGLAGLWQISGRNRLTYSERRELDLRLVRDGSLRTSLRVLVGSLAQVWTGENSW